MFYFCLIRSAAALVKEQREHRAQLQQLKKKIIQLEKIIKDQININYALLHLYKLRL